MTLMLMMLSVDLVVAWQSYNVSWKTADRGWWGCFDEKAPQNDVGTQVVVCDGACRAQLLNFWSQVMLE